jgi:hypothetical protein
VDGGENVKESVVNIRIATSIGLLVGCLAGLSAPVAGVEKADSTATVREGEAAGLERRLASLRREGRMLRRAAALLSEVALFDEGVGRGRSVSAEPPRGPMEPIVVQRLFSVGDEATGIGGGERGLPVSGTDVERVEADIRTLEMRLKELKKGAQKP